jgi:hypothetical protein
LQPLPIAVALVVVLPAASHAQVPRTPFVEGVLLVKSDLTVDTGQGSTGGGGADVGIALTDRYNLRFGAEIPRWNTSEDLAGTVRSRITSYSFLVARRYRPMSRVKIEALFGVSAMVSSLTRPHINAGWEWMPSEHTERWLAPTAGVAVPISLTRRLAVVPQVRIHSGVLGLLLGSYRSAEDIAWVSAGMRWQF